MSLQKKEIAALKAAMDTAQSSSEWYQYAQELDRLEGKYAWREDSQSKKFDADLLRREMATMQTLRANRKAFELTELLHESMHRNLGDFNSSGLYREAWSGTKLIIGEYLNELAYSIRFILDNDFDNITDAQKMHYLQQSDKNFGRSALVLSGGSTLGVFHIGVIKVLWEEKLLPRIISGSSMGSFVAGIVGTHTDAELDAFFGQSMGSRNTKFFRWNGITELVVTKALLDPDALATLIASQVKDYTFAEAYQLTGRIINISVSPTRAHQKPRVLNYQTAPDLLIRQSILASCSIPGLFPPVVLKKRTTSGHAEDYIPEEKWIDGSIVNDVPIKRLTRLLNVNHFIVSQTNPHVAPLINARRKVGFLPLLVDLSGSILWNQSVGVLEVIRRRTHHYPTRPILDWLHSFASQEYSGDINIRSNFGSKELLKVLSNLGADEVDAYVRAGELATYPKLEKIRNQTLISRTICEYLYTEPT